MAKDRFQEKRGWRKKLRDRRFQREIERRKKRMKLEGYKRITEKGSFFLVPILRDCELK